MLFPRHYEVHERVNSEVRSESFFYLFHSTEFQAFFSSAEWFRMEFLEFASTFVPRYGFPSIFLFRGMVRNVIPRDFCSAEQPEFRRNKPFVTSIPYSEELFLVRNSQPYGPARLCSQSVYILASDFRAPLWPTGVRFFQLSAQNFQVSSRTMFTINVSAEQWQHTHSPDMPCVAWITLLLEAGNESTELANTIHHFLDWVYTVVKLVWLYSHLYLEGRSAAFYSPIYSRYRGPLFIFKLAVSAFWMTW